MTKTADWNSLPGEIVQLIADKLSTVEDLVAFTCVSRYFRSSVQKDQWRPLDEVSHPPWLLLGCPDKRYSYNDQMSGLSMYKMKTFPMNHPQLRGRRLIGTTYGWILTLDIDFRPYLFNPLSQRRIPLPLRGLDRNQIFIQRAMLIKRPPFGFDDFIVVASENLGKLSVLRPEENTWETVKLSMDCFIHDIAHHNGQIYVTDRYGRLFVFSNLDGPGPLIEVECVRTAIISFEDTKCTYVLESSGDLLLVARFQNVNFPNRTYDFDVFKFNPQTKKSTRIEDLGDRSLFLGDSQSISLSSPATFNCRSNCIYFTDHIISLSSGMSPCDMDTGVYDIKRRTIQPFFKGAYSHPCFSAASWFIPKFS